MSSMNNKKRLGPICIAFALDNVLDVIYRPLPNSDFLCCVNQYEAVTEQQATQCSSFAFIRLIDNIELSPMMFSGVTLLQNEFSSESNWNVGSQCGLELFKKK